jgi:hypothetical protein
MTQASMTVEALEGRRMLAYATEFAFRLGGPLADSIADVATDPQGNAYVVGTFQGTVDFHPARGKTWNRTAVSPGGDGFVAAYAPDGRPIWTRQFPGVAIESVAIRRTFDLYLAGPLTSTADLDPNEGSVNLTPGADGRDVFLVRMDDVGRFNWATKLDSGREDVVAGLALDKTGYVHLATNTQTEHVHSEALPGQGGIRPFHAVPLQTPVLSKFNALGRNLYVQRFGVAGTDNAPATALAADVFGNVFLAGYNAHDAHEAIDLDPSGGVSGAAAGQAYLARYDATGNLTWVNALGAGGTTSNDVTILGLATDQDGAVYAGGRYKFAQDFNPHPNFEYIIRGAKGPDGFLAKYTPAGTFAWVKGPSSASSNAIQQVAVTSRGTVMVAGFMNGPTEFIPGGRSWAFAETGVAGFTAEYSADGELGNVYRFAGVRGFSSLAIGPVRQTWAVGALLPNDVVDFDPGPGTLPLGLAAGSDGFVLKRQRV